MAKPYLAVNQSALCYFDPTRCDQVEFEKGYTWWYWFIWGFPTLALFVLMNYWTYYGLNKWLDDQKKAIMGYLFIWWVIFFPLIFLLPIGVATKEDQVNASGKTIVLALAFSIMAIALGAIGYLWYTIKGGSLSQFFGISPAPIKETTAPPPNYETGEPASVQSYAKM